MKFTTLFVRDKYPDYYPKMLAKSLLPFNVEVDCYTDNPRLPMEENLNYILFNPALVPEVVRDAEQGWWYLMLFFNPEFTEEKEVWFVDVDVLFTAPPAQVFAWCQGFPNCTMAFQRAFFPDRMLAETSLFYLNHNSLIPESLWNEFQETFNCTAQLKKAFGPQKFVRERVREFSNVPFFPDHFQVSVPHWFGYRVDSLYQTGKRNVQSEDSIVSFSFLGKENPHWVAVQDDRAGKFFRDRFPWLVPMVEGKDNEKEP